MSDYTDENKPRERLISKGAENLTDAELIAILLRTGTRDYNVVDLAQRILKKSGDLAGLRHMNVESLQETPGVGPAKAVTLMAAIELGSRFAKAIVKNEDRARITCAADIYDHVRYDMETLAVEELRVLSLDTKHYLLAEDKLYKGTINASNIRIAEIFRRPLMLNAACFVMVHNHPSGDPTPSAADIMTTRAVMETGKKLDMPMLDHIIIGSGTYTSVKSYLE